MLTLGSQLPQLSSLNQEGELIHLKDFIGKKLVIFFYPKANTPGCTAEACDLNSHFAEFTKANYQIIGISADSVSKQKKFHEKFGFQYDLLADESKEIINAFGVWGRKKFMGKEYDGILRATFIFDENGNLTEVIDQVKTKEHSKQILK